MYDGQFLRTHGCLAWEPENFFSYVLNLARIRRLIVNGHNKLINFSPQKAQTKMPLKVIE